MISKQSKKLKRIVSGLLSLTMITNMSAVLPANAEEERTQGSESLTLNDNRYTNDEDIVSDDAVTGREDTDKKSKGDVNGDGVVNSDDRDLLHRWLVRLVGDNELDLESADVNFDGKVDIMDLIELIRLCPNTGSSDEEETSEHYIIDEDSEILSEINTDDNAFKVSLDITTSGGELNSLTAGESEYSSIIESDMVVGVVPEFECEEGATVDDVVLNFAVDDSFIENTNGKYADVSDDFEGIKRFNVFKYFDDIGMLLPVETTYENNVITTHVDELGTYCLIDMEQWFETLGIETAEYADTKASSGNTGMMETPAKAAMLSAKTAEVNKNIDIIFNVFPSEIACENIKTSIKTAGEKLYKMYGSNDSVRIYVVTSSGSALSTNENQNYAKNISELEEIVGKITYLSSGSNLNFDDFLKFYNKKPLRNDSDKYYFVVESRLVGENKVKTDSLAERFTTDHVTASVCSNTGQHKVFANKTDGENFNNSSIFGNEVADFIIKKHNAYAGKTKYTTLVPTGWKTVDLAEDITNAYKKVIDGVKNLNEGKITSSEYDNIIAEFNNHNYADTDGDGIIDLKEIRYSFNGEDIIEWDSNGYAILPTIKECRSLKAGKAYVENALSQYGFWDWKNVNDIRILPIYTDPSEKDSDFDDFIDSKDPDPMNYNIINIDDKMLDDSDSINGNNPDIPKQDELDKIMIGHVEAGSTKMYSGDEDEVPESSKCYKNEYIFTRTRKKGRSDAKFTLTPSREISDYAFTITNTNETKFGEGYTTDDYNSTVKISYKDGLIKKKVKQIEPVEIRPSDDGTEITYVFSLEHDKTYNISVNNPTNNHEGEYYIHVSEDNWVYAPDGGIRYNIEGYSENGEEYYECTDVFFSNQDLLDRLNSNNPGHPWVFLNAWNSRRDDVVFEIASLFYDGEELLGIDDNFIRDFFGELSTAATFLGVVPGIGIVGTVIGGVGAGSTALVILFDNRDSNDFETELKNAFELCKNNPNGDISLCYTHYKVNTKFEVEPHNNDGDFIDNYGHTYNRNKWSNWSTQYINKYVNGHRFEVTKGLNPELELAA